MATIGTRVSWDGGLGVGTDGTGSFDPAVVAPPTAEPERVVVATCIDSVDSHGTQFTPVVRTAQKNHARHRIVVGGKDITYFRGVQTPFPSYGLVSPLLYGSGLLTLPQIHAAFERPGVGALSWLKPFAKVWVQRVDGDGAVINTDFRGFIADFQHNGRDFTATLGGEATGWAAMQDGPMPIFPRVLDIGGQVMRAIQNRLKLPTANRPTTGIEVAQTGGDSLLEFLQGILAKSTERDGTQWTVMPNVENRYRMFQKDTSTIDATVYIDGFRVAQNLRRDFSEEPNRVWVTAVGPDGMRYRYATFPGLTEDIATIFTGNVSPGDTGDQVQAVIWRLWAVDRIDGDRPLEWTTDSGDPVTAAVEQLQDDVNLPVTGVVNLATWSAIFDSDKSGYGLGGSRILPAAQKSYTKQFIRSASGQVMGRNPNYDGTRPLVDVSVDMGQIKSPGQGRRWAQRELANSDVSNWVGTVTVNTGAVIDGEHNPGDTLVFGDVRDARSVKPGMNLWLPNWDGGTLVHVSGVNVSADSVEFAVDTRARDTMKVWEVIARNREARRTPERQWIAQNRRSGLRDDTGAFYDGGPFGKIQPVVCPANQWTVFPTPGGRSGTLKSINISTDGDKALFALAIFGKQIGPGQLGILVGDPFTKDGTKNWTHKQKTLIDDHWIVYQAGGLDQGVAQMCGYWPEKVDPDETNTTTKTGSVDASSDTFTVTSHGYSNGHQVFFQSASVPDGLTADNNYYVIGATTNTFKVAASPGGSAMDVTADASGVVIETRAQAFPPVTGDFRDPAGVAYFCKNNPVLWVAVYPDRDTVVQGGRILELQLDDSAG